MTFISQYPSESPCFMDEFIFSINFQVMILISVELIQKY